MVTYEETKNQGSNKLILLKVECKICSDFLWMNRDLEIHCSGCENIIKLNQEEFGDTP